MAVVGNEVAGLGVDLRNPEVVVGIREDEARVPESYSLSGIGALVTCTSGPGDRLCANDSDAAIPRIADKRNTARPDSQRSIVFGIALISHPVLGLPRAS
jgi:hypothetical protein